MRSAETKCKSRQYNPPFHFLVFKVTRIDQSISILLFFKKTHFIKDHIEWNQGDNIFSGQ